MLGPAPAAAATAAEPPLARSARHRHLAGAPPTERAALAGGAAAAAGGLAGAVAGGTGGWRGAPSRSAPDPTSAPLPAHCTGRSFTGSDPCVCLLGLRWVLVMQGRLVREPKE